MSYSLGPLITLQCSIAVAACGSASSELPCSTNDDCPSHFCKADRTCGPAEVDGGIDPIDGTDAPPSALCTPNHDGTVALNELPLVAGRMATFRTTTSGTFDTLGVANGDGTRHWDLSGALTGDGDTMVALAAPTGLWWAADFPTATYAVPLASGSDLLGVFRVDSTVELLGVVSPAAGSFQTKLTYDPPAKILAPPFAAGTTWTTTSAVSGTASGAIVAYNEKYASRVDQTGTMKTPYGEFPILRVATDLTRTSGFSTLLTKRQFVWVSECFGGVATVVSKDFEANAEFTDTAEIKRITP